MSVIVKGMEMPSCCSGCELNYDSLGCSAIQSDSAFDRPGFDMDTERLPDCPLRPLPKKHGRLIDADALPRYTGYVLSADEVATAVENAPTIVEAEGD